MFFHREKELKEINNELEGISKKILIFGKRRVGKTTLIKKLMEGGKNFIYFECIQDTLKENLKLLRIVLNKVVAIPSYVSFDTFQQVFEYINSLNIKYTFIFDEYPYLKKTNNKNMVDSVFQDVFDNYSSNLNFIICGSEISMMNELLTEGNPLFGRFTKKICIEELNYIESIVYELEDSTCLEDVQDIFEEISENVVFKEKLKTKENKNKNQKKKKQQKFSPIEYEVNGYKIYVGRNNKENDWLTLSFASKTDYWFHTKDVQGSHVILKADKEVNDDILVKVAEIAAKHSKAKMSSNVPVDYCLVQFVKKPNGSKPGMVIFTNNKTLNVNPQK